MATARSANLARLSQWLRHFFECCATKRSSLIDEIMPKRGPDMHPHEIDQPRIYRNFSMERSITPTGRVSTSLPAKILKKVEAFAAESKLNRSAAIGALVALGLKARSMRGLTLPPHSFA
jgi:hypothetical protein